MIFSKYVWRLIKVINISCVDDVDMKDLLEEYEKPDTYKNFPDIFLCDTFPYNSVNLSITKQSYI